MRRFWLATLLLALLPGIVGVGRAQEQPNFYAVIIGVSKFSYLPENEWLQYADADAKAFHRFITSPRGRGFLPENVYLLTDEDASYQAIRSRLGSTLAKKLKPDDTVYIFVATHGMVEREAAREGYLLANDSDREDLYSSALPMRELGNIIQNRLRTARRVFLFADACRAGKLGQAQGSVNRYIEDVSRQRGEVMGLLASRPNEFSREGPQFGGGHGLFTYYLLKGLMGEADVDNDSTVTASEIVTYLQAKVTDASQREQNIRDFGEFEPDTPMAFVDKPGPDGLSLSKTRRPNSTEVASLQGMIPQSLELRQAFERSLSAGDLLAPPRDNAWEIFERYQQLPVPDAQKESAQEDLLIALATAGDKVLGAYRRGDALIPLTAQDYEQGARLFDRASQLDPDDPSLTLKARFLEGRSLIERRQFDQGMELVRQVIAADPQAAYSYNALGIAYMEQKRWNEAIQNFRLASDRAEKWIYPRYNLSRAYAALSRFREAEQELLAAIRLGSDLGLKYSYLHYNLGILYLFQGRNNDSEQQFRRAIEMKPDDAMSHHNLGLIYQRRNNREQAEKLFRRAIELDRGLVEPHLKLAELYARDGDPARQEAALRAAMAADGQNSAAAESLGQFLLENRRLDEAEQVFVALLGNDPQSASAFSGLGDVHAAQGNVQQAADDYRQAIARTTDARVRRQLEQKLGSLTRRR